MGRIGIAFTSLWNVVSSSPAPEYGTQPARLESDKVPGLFIDCKKNWVQLGAKNGLCIYVARQKVTRQVDLSGFGKGLVGTEPLRAKNGRVEAHLDLADPNALAHLHMLCTMMVSLPDPEKAKKAPPVTEAGKARKAKEAAKPDAASSPFNKLDAVAATERIARIFAIASLRNSPVSEARIQECLEKGGTLPPDLDPATGLKRVVEAAPEPVIEVQVEAPVETTVTE